MLFNHLEPVHSWWAPGGRPGEELRPPELFQPQLELRVVANEPDRSKYKCNPGHAVCGCAEDLKIISIFQ